MKNIYSLVLIVGFVATLSSCRTGGGGELVGVPQKNYRSEVPFGMVYIPAGSF
jgi:sulfatase modifying factor 1